MSQLLAHLQQTRLLLTRARASQNIMIIYIHHRVPQPRFLVRPKNFSDSAMNEAYIAYLQCACAKLPYFYLRSEIWRHHRVPQPKCPTSCENSSDARTFKAEIGIFMFAWIFKTFWLKVAVLGAKRGTGCAMLTPNELVLTFMGRYLCATFDENRLRNAIVRVHTDRKTDRHTRRQRQTEFIICPILYSITIGQIRIKNVQ